MTDEETELDGKMGEPPTNTPDFEVTVLDEPRRPTAVERTHAAMAKYNEGRKNQARAFFKRVKKSITKRNIQKASRKRNR